MKRFICFFLLFAVLLCPAASAEPLRDGDISISAPSAILMEKYTGEVLYEKNAHERIFPASVTKVMTMLLIIEDIESGKLKLDDTVTASARAASFGGSCVYLEEGEQMSVDDMLKCIAVVSANDCAIAMAEHISGTEQLFVERMNRRAEELGLEDTHFTGCTGLFDDGEHYTSAYDVAVMSRELIGHELIKNYTTIWMDSIRGGKFELSNTNKLVYWYQGCTGLKTGSTDAAGYCISATAERDGMELIAVVLGSETSQQRFEDAKTMLNYGFSTYVLADITPEETPMAPVRLGRTPSVEASLTQSKLLVGKGQAGGLTRTVKLQEDLSAPVEKGQAVGILTVQSGDTTLAELPLTAAAAVEHMTWGDLFTRLLRAAVFG